MSRVPSASCWVPHSHDLTERLKWTTAVRGGSGRVCWLYRDAEDSFSWVRFSRTSSSPDDGLLKCSVLYCLDDSNSARDGSLEERGVALYVSIVR